MSHSIARRDLLALGAAGPLLLTPQTVRGYRPIPRCRSD